MSFSIGVFWYLFTNQLSTLLNYFYYPYLISGTITFCDDLGCADYKVLPYFLSVVLTDFMVLLFFLKFWAKNTESNPILLDD